MTKFEYSEIEFYFREIKAMFNEVCKHKKYEELGEYVPCRKAYELKGVGTWSHFQRTKCYQPCGGTHYEVVYGKKCWKKELVLEWLLITDEDLPKYLKKFGVSIPAKKEGVA
ncbi:MAG: hypothetical protein ACRC4W_06055 [Treponemataceae bacterium]